MRDYIEMYNAIYNRMKEVCSEEEMFRVETILNNGLRKTIMYKYPLVSTGEMERIILEVSL